MKKRYLYSALASGLFFILLYIILEFNVFICLLFTAVFYIGGIFFFKEKDVRTYDPNIIMHYCYLISKLSNYVNKVKEEEISNKIKNISKDSEHIINMLEQKPNKVTQVYDSFDYFIPLTIKVIEQYIIIIEKEKKTAEEQKFIKNIDSFLDNIQSEIFKLLENMNYTKMIDINANIEVFKIGNNILHSNILKDRSDKDV